MENQMNRKRKNLLFTALGVTGFLLMILGLVDLWTGPRRFDFLWIPHPNNPINWMTALNLVFAGAAAGWTASLYGSSEERHDWVMRLLWSGLAVVFALGATDEIFEIHEWAGGVFKSFRAQRGIESLPAHLFEGNIVLALYAVGACGVFSLLLPLLKKDPFSYKAFCAGIVFQVTALACERFFGWAEDVPKPWVLIAYLEETCELFATLFYALAMAFIAIKLEAERR
ncbi:MAG: hypothetical protein ACE5GQ_01420 [Nitrospinales bacterium]